MFDRIHEWWNTPVWSRPTSAIGATGTEVAPPNGATGATGTVITPPKSLGLQHSGAVPLWPLQSACELVYGNPAHSGWEHANLVSVPCPWPLLYNGKYLAKNSITIHRKCAGSLSRVLNSVWQQAGQNPAHIAAMRADRFSGSYNYRPMRGSSSLSMHAYGCAIDFDDEDNQFHHIQHFFKPDHPLVKAFKAEGWEWGGDWSPGSVDAMHFQAARVR